MASGSRKRKRASQRGVQAVFTTDSDWNGRPLAAAGAFLTGVGAALWVWAVQPLRGLANPLGILDKVPSLILVSLGMVLVVGGVGLCTYFLVVRRTRRENERIRSAIYELQALIEPESAVQDSTLVDPGLGRSSKQSSFPRFSKMFGVALGQGLVMLGLYGGLVQEYRSNVNMQSWVHANISVGSYLLNEGAVALLGTSLVGLIILQFARRGHASNGASKERLSIVPSNRRSRPSPAAAKRSPEESTQAPEKTETTD